MQDVSDSGVHDQMTQDQCSISTPTVHRSPAKSPGKAPSPGASNRPNNVLEDDIALAKLLQEQERAYFLLTMGLQDEGDAEAAAEAPADTPAQQELPEAAADDDKDIDDEELARRLQREMDEEALRALYAAQFNMGNMEEEQQEVEETDIDALGYDDLNRIGDVAGIVSKGLPAAAIASLPTASFKTLQAAGKASMEKCCICQVEFEGEDDVTALPACSHVYHSECVSQWLGINKVCPVCNTEVQPQQQAA